MWVFSPLRDAPDYSSKWDITAPLITRHNQTLSTYNVHVYKVQTESIYTYGLCAMGRDTSGRPPGTSKSPEFGQAFVRAFVSNHQCLLFEEWANALRDPGANKYTTASAGHKHRKQLCGRGCGGQLKTHMPCYINIHGHTDMCHIQDIRSGGLHFLKSWDRFLKFVQDLTASFWRELHGF